MSIRSEGLDLDRDGYQVTLRGALHGTAGINDVVEVDRLTTGTYEVGLTGLAPNCAFDGSGAVTVAVTPGQVVPVEFAVVCTATTGVIKVVVEVAASPGVTPGHFTLVLDGAPPVAVDPGRPLYLRGVAGRPRACPRGTGGVRVRTGPGTRDGHGRHPGSRYGRDLVRGGLHR